MKLLLKQQANAKKASGNLIKAIEQGIITEQTKTRLAELEQEITALDFDIGREKQRCYSFVTKDNIKEYLENKVFANTADKQIRKFLIKTFIREVILYDDRIYIDYNFVEPKIISKLDKEHVNDTEKQIEDSIQSAFTFNLCSSTFGNCRPDKNDTNRENFAVRVSLSSFVTKIHNAKKGRREFLFLPRVWGSRSYDNLQQGIKNAA